MVLCILFRHPLHSVCRDLDFLVPVDLDRSAFHYPLDRHLKGRHVCNQGLKCLAGIPRLLHIFCAVHKPVLLIPRVFHARSSIPSTQLRLHDQGLQPFQAPHPFAAGTYLHSSKQTRQAPLFPQSLLP